MRDSSSPLNRIWQRWAAAVLPAGLLVLSPAGAAWPQEATVARCRGLLQPFAPAALEGPGVLIETAGPYGCRFGNLRFATTRTTGYLVASLVEHGLPFDLAPGKTVPTVARIEARGIAFSLHSGQAKVDWLSQQQQTPFDVTLDGRYDPATKQLVLNEATVDGEWVGHSQLRGVVDNADLAQPSSASLERAGVRSLHWELDSKRLLTAFALSPVLALLPEEDPAAGLEAAKAQVITGLNVWLAATHASAETVQALTGFVHDFPRPQHPFALDVEASSPVTTKAVQRAMESTAVLATLLRTITVAATYAGQVR